MQHQPLPHAGRKIKKTRGGPKGNQNARKHGFYSTRFTPAELEEIRNIINTKGIDPELAAFRVKLHSALKRDPGNRRLLRESAGILAKWCSVKHDLNKEDSRFVHSLLSTIFNNLTPITTRPEKTSCSEKTDASDKTNPHPQLP